MCSCRFQSSFGTLCAAVFEGDSKGRVHDFEGKFLERRRAARVKRAVSSRIHSFFLHLIIHRHPSMCSAIRVTLITGLLLTRRPDPAACEKTALIHALARCADRYKAWQNTGGGADNSDAILASNSRVVQEQLAKRRHKVWVRGVELGVLPMRLQAVLVNPLVEFREASEAITACRSGSR